MLQRKARSQHYEAEVSLMQNSLKDRTAIFNSQFANLQATVQNQKDLQVQRSWFTKEETKANLILKLSQYQDEFRQGSFTLQSMMQSENDVAKEYKSRYETITQVTPGGDPATESAINALKDRLDNEEKITEIYRNKRDEADQRSLAHETKLMKEESGLKNTEDRMIQVRKRLEVH